MRLPSDRCLFLESHPPWVQPWWGDLLVDRFAGVYRLFTLTTPLGSERGWKARCARQGPLMSEVLGPVTCVGENRQVWPGGHGFTRDKASVELSTALKGTRPEVGVRACRGVNYTLYGQRWGPADRRCAAGGGGVFQKVYRTGPASMPRPWRSCRPRARTAPLPPESSSEETPSVETWLPESLPTPPRP